MTGSFGKRSVTIETKKTKVNSAIKSQIKQKKPTKTKKTRRKRKKEKKKKGQFQIWDVLFDFLLEHHFHALSALIESSRRVRKWWRRETLAMEKLIDTGTAVLHFPAISPRDWDVLAYTCACTFTFLQADIFKRESKHCPFANFKRIHPYPYIHMLLPCAYSQIDLLLYGRYNSILLKSLPDRNLAESKKRTWNQVDVSSTLLWNGGHWKLKYMLKCRCAIERKMLNSLLPCEIKLVTYVVVKVSCTINQTSPPLYGTQNFARPRENHEIRFILN